MTATFQDPKFGDRVLLTPRVPQGLAAAVEGLTREVIRHRPENIYVFAAHHFEKLMRLREQYDDKTENNKNMKLLHDMSEAIKERHGYTKETNNHSGWSLNETAKVLERHRSIFGETGQKMSTEEVRELANETIVMPPKLQECSSSKKSERRSAENKNMAGKYTSRKKESPRVPPQELPKTHRNDSRGTPKIISQIPLAKDIKTELRKNRISSKDRKKVDEKKMQVACDYSRETTTTTTIEKTSRRSIERTKRTFETRSEQRKSSRTEDSLKKKTDATKDKVDSPKVKRPSRSLSMDRVKNYVVQNFIGMTSLDELQSPRYVEKVQEVIDETSTVIKEKVEALKIGVVKASRTKQSKKERSSSSEEQSKSSNKSITSGKKSQEASLRESSTSQNVADSAKTMQGNVESTKSLDNDVSVEQSESKKSDHSDASNESKISLPAVRPPSSKSTSRSLSARSDSDGLVLPPISPESTKSPKVKEELVLPVLSPPRSTAETPDVSVVAVNLNCKTVQKNQANNDEEFQDSLNVTPELRDELQRPDSLETSEVVDKSDSSGHVSPLETLKDKLLEIEEVQKRIEGVLDDTVINEDKSSGEKKVTEETGVTSQIQDKLLEIQESERRIEKILDSQSATVNESEMNTDIKTKLQELEDAERRIENILFNETEKQSTNQTSTTESNIEQKDSNLTANILTHLDSKNANKNEKQSELKLKADESSKTSANGNNGENKIAAPAENVRLLSPHSYILTEGSPCEIPDSVTTVIIPDRIPTPDSDTLQVEIENGEIYSTLISSKESNCNQLEESQEENESTINDAFGEAVDVDNVEISTVDAEYIRGIKANHDKIVSRQDLGLIQEERDKEADEAGIIDSEDEKVLKVVTSSLEEILEKDEVEYATKEEVHTIVKKDLKETGGLSPEAAHVAEYDSTDETKETSITDGFVENNTDIVENSLDNEEITARSAESTNEIKETTVTTDRSSLTFDSNAPMVPELNLDSLPDLTISSFNITDDEQKDEGNKKGSNDSNSIELPISSENSKENVSGRKVSPKKQSSAEEICKETESKSIKTLESSRKEDQEIIEEFIREESKHSSIEILKELQKEFVEKIETEEYEKLEEILQTNKSETTKVSETIQDTVLVENKTIQDAPDKQTSVDNDTVAEMPVHSDVEAVNINKTVDAKPEDINNFVCAESGENKQVSSTASENQNNLSAFEGDDADSSSEQKHLNVIESDQPNNQLADSSRASSQCTTTRRLDSDELSIKTSADEIAPHINQRQDTNDKREEPSATTENALAKEETTAQQSDDATDEKKQHHIYVPEMSTSKDLSSTTESSTFMSAATKIQAGVRAFLTRRRLQSTQRRSSTLDSVPSIQESFAVENNGSVPTEKPSISTSQLMPIVVTVSSISDSKARNKLRREDAVQQTTLSVENAFADNQLQHTGEFHDCIPLPVFDAQALDLKVRSKKQEEKSNSLPGVEQLLEKLLLEQKASKLGQFVDVVLLPGDTTDVTLQNSYLNFITSVEDVFSDPLLIPGSPKGVIIEEITSLDENKSSTSTPSEAKNEESAVSEELSKKSDRASSVKKEIEIEDAASLVEASISTSEEPLSMNIEEVLGLGEEDEGSRKGSRLTTDLLKSSSASQESHLSDARTRSPVMMMQIAPTNVQEKSEEDKNNAKDHSTKEKELQSPNEKSNDSV